MHYTLVSFFIAVALSSGAASIIGTQFHSQDGIGGYSYGYTGGPSSKTEHGTAGGAVSGSYSYIDGNGALQTAIYTADEANGFRVQASNLPVAPALPPALAVLSAPVDRPLGIPVIDTPEVAAAKVAHLAAVEHQKQIIASHPSRRRRDTILTYLPLGFSYTTSAILPDPPAPTLLSAPVDRPLGVPVVDTPEVAAAKVAHLAAIEHQKQLIDSYPNRR